MAMGLWHGAICAEAELPHKKHYSNYGSNNMDKSQPEVVLPRLLQPMA